MQIVKLKWHGPYDLSLLEYRDSAYEFGIYAISHNVRGKERLLYIGSTIREFLTRINEHSKWLINIRGPLKVRVATIDLQERQRFSQKRLADVEALLITSHAPSENTINYTYYYGRDKLTVVNIGRRGKISPRVCTVDLEWCK